MPKGRVMIPVALKNQMVPFLNQGFVIKRSVFQPLPGAVSDV